MLPVALQGSGKVWGKTQRLFRPGTIRVRVLPLLEKPEGKVSPDRLLEDVQRSITGALEENR